MPQGVSSLAFVESQAAHIESRVRRIRYGKVQYPGLAFVSREASPYADTITYYSIDGSGDMVFIANRADDIPLVQVTKQQHNVPIDWLAIGYDWTHREIGQAMRTGVNLPDEKVRTAFSVAERIKDRIFFLGDENHGWDGLINHTSVPVEVIGGGNQWLGATPPSALEIVQELNNLITGVWTGTNEARLAGTVLFSPEMIGMLATRPIGDDANKPIMEYFKKYNVFTLETGQELMVRSVRRLSAAGGSASQRVVAYDRDQEVLRFHVPQELTFQEPMREKMGYAYYGALVLAGLEIMEPTGVRYLDGTS